MSLGESTNVLANAIGRIDCRAKQPQLDFPNTYPLDGDLSAGLCYPTFEQLEPVLLGHVSCTFIKTTTTTTQRTHKKKTRKQGFKDKCMFQLLARHPFVAAINYIVFEGNIIVSKFVVTNLSRSKCIECIVHTMCR